MPEEATPTAPSPPTPSRSSSRARSTFALLVNGALAGVPVAIAADSYLKAVNQGQKYFFSTLPSELRLHGAPVWWPLPILALCGFMVGATLRYLPGSGGPQSR